MDRHAVSEQRIITNPNHLLTAERFGGAKLIPEPRRQNKIIGALTRKFPGALLADSILITPQERMAFEARWSTKRLDRWKDSDIEQALSALPLPTMQEENIRQPVNTFKRFEGTDTLQRRMRRVVSLVTRGTPATPDVVNPYDLYNFVKNKCRNAVAFERKIPEILQALDTAGLGAGNYHEAVNEIGVTLFGSQWVYLQQVRLLEKHIKKNLDTQGTQLSNNRVLELTENDLLYTASWIGRNSHLRETLNNFAKHHGPQTREDVIRRTALREKQQRLIINNMYQNAPIVVPRFEKSLQEGKFVDQQNTYGMHTCYFASAVNGLRALGIRQYTEKGLMDAIGGQPVMKNRRTKGFSATEAVAAIRGLNDTTITTYRANTVTALLYDVEFQNASAIVPYGHNHVVTIPHGSRVFRKDGALYIQAVDPNGLRIKDLPIDALIQSDITFDAGINSSFSSAVIIKRNIPN